MSITAFFVHPFDIITLSTIMEKKYMRNDIISQNIELIDGKVVINDKKLFLYARLCTQTMYKNNFNK